MSTKKSTDTPADAPTVVQFPGAFTLFKPSITSLWRNIFTIVEGLSIVIVVCGLAILAGVLGAGSNAALHVPMRALAVLFGLSGIVLVVIAGAGFTVLQLKSVQGRTVTLREAYEDGKKFALRMLGVHLVMVVVFMVSLLLFVVPFFFMLRRYYLAPYFLADRDLGVFDAMKASSVESRRYGSAVWGLIGVKALISIVGFVPFAGTLAGSVLDLLYSFAPAVRYMQMKEAANGGVIVTGVEPPVTPADDKK